MKVIMKCLPRCVWLSIAVLMMVVPSATGMMMMQVEGIHDATEAPCGDCHVCATPTVEEPCLKICLREGRSPAANHTAAEGPDVAVLDELEFMYQPVSFNHKLHAEMVGMGEGCETCHHFSAPGKYPPCSECHSPAADGQHLKKPGLKGAFHRQCMGCHREWSHDTQCIVCHLPSDEIAAAAGVADATDIVGIAHPIITEPDTRVYHTPYDAGPVVTFHHKEHIELFHLRCTDCHQQENCGYCHDMQKPASLTKSMEEVHAICNDCHLKDRCDKCHGTREKPRFEHAETGWPLARFHRQLDCRACHPTGRRIGRLNSDCNNCHAGWNQANFNHAVTGLILDETHRELDCEDCHPSRHLGAEPHCYDCHDDGRSALTQPPGQRLPWPSN